MIHLQVPLIVGIVVKLQKVIVQHHLCLVKVHHIVPNTQPKTVVEFRNEKHINLARNRNPKSQENIPTKNHYVVIPKNPENINFISWTWISTWI